MESLTRVGNASCVTFAQKLIDSREYFSREEHIAKRVTTRYLLPMRFRAKALTTTGTTTTCRLESAV
jgi:hypothetical protein